MLMFAIVFFWKMLLEINKNRGVQPPHRIVIYVVYLTTKPIRFPYKLICFVTVTNLYVPLNSYGII